MILKLSNDTRVARSPNGRVFLVTPRNTPALQIGGGAAAEVLTRLVDGTTRAELIAAMRRAHPGSREVEPSIDRFITKLSSSELLEGSELEDGNDPGQSGEKRYHLLNPDPAVHRLVTAVAHLPSAVVWLILGAVVGVASLEVARGLPLLVRRGPADLVMNFEPYAILLFLFIWVPLHELSHAVACRAAGAPVSGAGIVFKGRFFPTPYVDTRFAYLIESRFKRLWIPSSGLIADFVLCGASLSLVLHAGDHSYLAGVGASLFFVGQCTLFFNLNPLRRTDGSNTLEVLFGDDLLRVSALLPGGSKLSTRRAIGLYRMLSGAYVVAALALLSFYVIDVSRFVNVVFAP